MIPAKGNVRRKYGGTITRHGFRKGDLVKSEMAGRISIGWVSGDTARQISVSNFDWKRLGQFTFNRKKAPTIVTSGKKVGRAYSPNLLSERGI